MTEETESSLPIARGTLRVVYLVGIALNVVALTVAAAAGETVGALTLGLIIVYLGVRYRMLDVS
ncbi:hypothetical protein SAMN05216226_11217 [Halovenus aranensis]|jgi:hypothetical protein|uniref:Uncharacterized protein n=1 Tax=Halovenus aranensis TaxID=890420 RepID=A0A1G8XPX0_9EURY|nr:hypothetical protein [Halovenus aranensis]SDJ92629.1 hypothetical protein SAMN05216226_11217 [Halovenus aranensis]